MNEPNLAAIGGAPAGYDAAAYGRDFKIFRSFMKQAAPETMILGPGTTGRDASRRRPARRLQARRGCGFISLLWDAVGAMQRQGHARGGALRRLAVADRSGAGVLSIASRSARARQADLAHGNRGCRLRRKSLGRELPRYVPLSRSARAAGEGRRSSRHAQHAGGKRLRPARRKHAGSPGRIIGARCCGDD